MDEISHNELPLRSEEVTEILTTPPAWLYRWGISVILGLILLGMTLMHFISYPDTLTGKATVTSLDPTINLVAKRNGKLTKILVQNNEVVTKGQVLAVTENTASLEDIAMISKFIESTEQWLSDHRPLKKIEFRESIQLGDITSQYLQFLKAYTDFSLFLEIGAQRKELALLSEELVNQQSLLSKYETQMRLQNEELALTEKDYLRDQGLSRSGIISLRDFESKKKEILRGRSVAEAQNIAVTNAKITIGNIEKSKIRLQMQYQEQFEKLRSELTHSIRALKSAIENWKQEYLFITPASGRVSFFNYWTINQNIKAGEDVFSIVPTSNPKLVAKLLLPLNNSGKVKAGQTVNIKLDSYPYVEHGMLIGRVNNISLVASNNSYSLDIDLPNGLLTSYKKTLVYRSEMIGIGEVITDNTSLLERFFYQFKSILSTEQAKSK